MSVGQAVSGPQDFVLRRGAVFVLCFDEEWQEGMSFGGVFFQGEALSAEVQCFVYYDHAAVPKTGIWTVFDRFQ